MSEQSAIRLLQTAIENVRSTCTGPECKALIAAVDAADSAAEKYLGEPDDNAEDKKAETAPSRKDAPKAARKLFAQAREGAESSPK